MYGSMFSVNYVGRVFGEFITKLKAWHSGSWVDLNLIGGGFEKIVKGLPFYHSENFEKDNFGVFR